MTVNILRVNQPAWNTPTQLNIVGKVIGMEALGQMREMLIYGLIAKISFLTSQENSMPGYGRNTQWLSKDDAVNSRMMFNEIMETVGSYDAAVVHIGTSKWCMTKINENRQVTKFTYRKILYAYNALTPI